MPFSFRPRRAGLAAAGAAALALSGCGADQPPKAEAAAPVVSALTVERTSVPLALELPGRTAPFLLAEVRARVDGIVQERRFVEGADVRKGDPLYVIDPAPYRAALGSAQATLQRARANLASTTAQLDRYKVLVGGNAVSKQAYDNAEAAQLQAAADVAAAEAALTTARINLGYTSVSAPIAGRSSVSQVTQGAYVQAGSATLLTTIQQLDPMYVDLQQSSAEGLALRRDIASGSLKLEGAGKAQVRLKLEDGSTYAHPGTLEISGVTVDRDTGSVTLRARFPNPEKLLLPGMFVRASVEQGVRQGVVRVPAAAVTRNPQGEATVMLVGAGNKTEVRTVQAGALVDGHWLVEHGLKDGERLVVSGVQKLRPGVVVTPRTVAPSKLATAPGPAAPAAR
ncbi:efflux RND transporter periplasmic adaptor subunit [Pseudoduganella umbonata]|uniref:Efflux RND transporter periplasmic adaptor subunit n=1 Tax=Pseudoduganella umbonata TaxID=864828 RepID=A0A4P8HPQ3_9BURK|nr:efflux RND transporter periplasmic adaptor subunit [Pseudoduganella umbonata]MBB3221111.1 membrane fusion protein (multidrug efflux system) [Pseudoduganella umbonata]QCP10305.1 efflux RND transporter periplasmic adaptor subunit [Pseudoduganella umbonata]